MSKISYELIAAEADRLFIKMATAPDIKSLQYWHAVYLAFLEGTGWDPISFDKETQKRVDADWNDLIIWN
jgi:hypothetical protein